MTIIRNSMKITVLLLGLLLLGSAVAAPANAWALVCEMRAGKFSCYIQE